MPRSQTILISPVVALVAMGFALAVAQERGPGQAGGANPRGAAQRVQAAPQPDPARMDELLRLWAAQNAKLKSLELSIYRIDKDKAWDEEEHYIGRAAFQAPHFAFLDYRKVKMQLTPDPENKNKKVLVPSKNKAGKIDAPPYETIVCSGTEIWHYRYAKRQIIVYTLDKETRKRALEEGPLPFLFNMNAGEAKRRYAMTLHSEDEKRYLVMLQPLLPEDKEVFSVAWLSLDKKWLLPTRIMLISPDRKIQQDFALSEIKANGPVPASLFKGVDPGKPWKVERNPGRDVQGPANARNPRRPGDPQAAERAAARGVDQQQR